MSGSKIQLDILMSPSSTSMEETRYWFHATSWQSAEEIMKFGPKIYPKRSDLAVNGAFYLNPDLDDCYDWLLTKNNVFQGKHAFLVYRFAFSDLSGRVEELTNLVEWKNVARRWSTTRCPEDCTYTFQNSDPKNIESKGHHVTPRRMDNGELAMQLIIRTEKLCRLIHLHLVGCIFFEKLAPAKINNGATSSLRQQPMPKQQSKASKKSR